MAARRNKVKRYKNIYSDSQRKRRRIVGAVVTICLCGVIAFVGYSAYKPLMSFLNGEMTFSTSEASAVSPNSATSSPDVLSEGGAAVNSSPLQNQEVQGVFVPVATLKDEAAFATFLADSKNKGYTAVVIEAKDNEGMVQYQSAVPEVLQAAAQVPDAFPLRERIAATKAAGLTPIVRLVAFEDNKASRVLEASFVMYRGSNDFRWLDNSPEAGGRGWLSPESAVAQGYITALAKEIASMGGETILLSSFQYPTGLGTNLAYSGPLSDENKLGVLQAYATALTATLKEQKASYYLEVPALSILQGDDVRYGGSPLDIGAKNLAPEIYPSSLPAPLVIGTENIPAPKDAPYETTKVVFTEIKTMSAGKVEDFLPILQSFDGYEGGLVKEQEKALTDLGEKNEILYNPAGIYP